MDNGLQHYILRERSLIMAGRALEEKLIGHETRNNNLDGYETFWKISGWGYETNFHFSPHISLILNITTFKH